MTSLVVRHWQIVVALLVAANLLGDVLAKRHRPIEAVVTWALAGVGWAVLLGTSVPMGRSVSLSCVASYVVTAVVATALFGESMTPSQWVGAGLGLIAIGLLA